MDGSAFTRGMRALVLAFTFFASSAHADVPVFRRSVTFELEEVEGASAYQFELTGLGAEGKRKPHLFQSSKPVWNGRLKPGRYEVRLRTLDDRGVFGPWSEVMPLEVRPPPAELKTPAAMSEIIAQEDAHAVEFNWVPVPGAVSYKLHVRPLDAAAGETAAHETKETLAGLTLAAGHEYEWTVTATTDDGLESEPVEPKFRFRLIGPRLKPPAFATAELANARVRFTWRRPAPAQITRTELAVEKSKDKWVKVDSASLETEDWRSAMSENEVHKLALRSAAPLHPESEPSEVYVEKRGSALNVYGATYPSPEERWALTRWRYKARVAVATLAFEGTNALYNSSTKTSGARGVQLAAGVERHRAPWRVEAEGALSVFDFGDSQNNLRSQLMDLLTVISWERGLRLGSMLLHPVVAVHYHEIPEVIGQNQVLALQYAREAGFGFGVRLKWPRRRWLWLAELRGEQTRFTLQSAHGALKSEGNGNLELRVHHQFANWSGYGLLRATGRRYTNDASAIKMESSLLGLGVEF